MKIEPGYLFGMALQSIAEPRKIAGELFAIGLPRPVLWQMLALMLVIGAAIGVASSILFPVAPELQSSIFAQPLTVALLEGAVAVISVFMIYVIGQRLGGTGTFEAAQMTIIWLNFVLLIIQAGVFVLSLFAPGLAAMLWVAGGVAGFRILSCFVAEAHGFVSAARVFWAILLISFVLVAILSVFLALFGVGAESVGEFGNV